MVTANDSYSGFIDYQEQIHRLRCKGIMIPDSVDAGETTLSILSTVPYRYLTNTYSKVRPILENEKISLENLYFIHTEFNNLHTILLKYILIIEQSLKNKLSYIISKKYGVETDCNILFNKDPGDYLSFTHYSGDKNNRIAKIKQVIQKPYNGSSLEYYKNTQNIPPWIVLENLPLGKAINWYKILKNDDKTLVSRSLFLFQPQNLLISDIKELVSKSLAILNEYRNMYAHRYREHQEYIKNELPFRPMMTEYKDVFFFEDEYRSGTGKKDLLALIIVLCIFSPSLMDYVQLVDDLSNFKKSFNSGLSKMDADFRSKLDPYVLFGLSEDIIKRLVGYVAMQYR